MADDADIKSFDYKAFAADLSGQADAVIPSDIQKKDREFIVTLIDRFCQMAGNALVKEENSKLTASQASLIVQFIGEWIFHKSIDLIRAKIDDLKYREGILQKVAFTVFDIAKKAVENDIPQEQLISLVEAQVIKSFTKAVDEMKEKGLLSAEVVEDAKNQSNIDEMAKAEVEEETTQEIASMSDSKITKLAALAVLMRNFSPERIKSILQKFEKPERDILISYLKMPDLEEKLDITTAMKYFEEMKQALPETVVISYDKAFKKTYKIVKNSNKNQILDIIKEEKPAVQEFVLSCYNHKRKKLPAHIANTVAKYLEDGT